MPVHLRLLPPAELGASSIPSYSSLAAESQTAPAQQFVNIDCRYYTITGNCPREATFCKYTHNKVARDKFLAAHKKPDGLDKSLVRKHQLARTFIDEGCVEFTKSGRCSREKDFCPFTHNQMERDVYVDSQKKQAKAKKLAAASLAVTTAVDLAGGKTFGRGTHSQREEENATMGKRLEGKGKLDASRQKLQHGSPNVQTISKESEPPSKIAASNNASKQNSQQDISAVVIKDSEKPKSACKQKPAQPQNKPQTTPEHKIPREVEASKAAGKQKPNGRVLSSTPCKNYSVSGFCRFKNKCGFLHIDKTPANVDPPGDISHTTASIAAIKTAIASLVSSDRPKHPPHMVRATTSRKNGSTTARATSCKRTPPSKSESRKESSKLSKDTVQSTEQVTTSPRPTITGGPRQVKPAYSAVTRILSSSELVSTTFNVTALANQGSTAPLVTPELSSLAVQPRKAFLDVGVDPRVKVTDLGFGCWDSEAIAVWAKRNLRPELTNKLLRKYKPYIDRGVLPLSATTERRRHKNSPSEFHLFFHFPGEIKAMIWRFALLNSSYESHVYVSCQMLQDGTFCRSIRPMLKSPSLCRTCSQSREIARKFYELAFSTSPSEVRFGMVYFNFDTDRLMLRASDPRQLVEFAEVLQEEDRKRLKYLSVPLSYWINGDKRNFIWVISTFARLRVLYLVVSDSRADEVYARDLQTLAIIKVHLREAFKQRYNGQAFEINVVMQTIGALKARRWGLEDIQHGEHGSEKPAWEGDFPDHKLGTLSRWT